ncbi:nucleotidyltransferase domain-containing protein [Sedimentisphaera cyanobacteriorum]|nr:nucleotidyltransferase domain-containing protein [Sedimentisphaera cyanobacteriorum]
MVEIEKIKSEIVESLKPLNPEKIILFGSYASGTANEDSDIDLFLVKAGYESQRCEFDTDALMALRTLIKKYKIGFDVFSSGKQFLETREDYFFKTNLIDHGVVLYAK